MVNDGGRIVYKVDVEFAFQWSGATWGRAPLKKMLKRSASECSESTPVESYSKASNGKRVSVPG